MKGTVVNRALPSLKGAGHWKSRLQSFRSLDISIILYECFYFLAMAQNPFTPGSGSQLTKVRNERKNIIFVDDFCSRDMVILWYW